MQCRRDRREDLAVVAFWPGEVVVEAAGLEDMSAGARIGAEVALADTVAEVVPERGTAFEVVAAAVGKLVVLDSLVPTAVVGCVLLEAARSNHLLATAAIQDFYHRADDAAAMALVVVVVDPGAAARAGLVALHSRMSDTAEAKLELDIPLVSVEPLVHAVGVVKEAHAVLRLSMSCAAAIAAHPGLPAWEGVAEAHLHRLWAALQHYRLVVSAATKVVPEMHQTAAAEMGGL